MEYKNGECNEGVKKKIMATKWLLQMWLETHKWCLTNLKHIGDIFIEISCENNK